MGPPRALWLNQRESISFTDSWVLLSTLLSSNGPEYALATAWKKMALDLWIGSAPVNQTCGL